jgi:hypothetical protein
MNFSQFRRRVDPRITLGLVLITVSVVGVSTLLVATRTTTVAFAATTPLATGHVVQPTDLVPVNVNLGSARGSYVGEGELMAGAVVAHPIAAGELISTAALAPAASASSSHVVVRITSPLPADARAGTLVDVWVALVDQQGAFGAPFVIIEDAQLVSITPQQGLISSGYQADVELVIPTDKLAMVLEAQANKDALSLIPSTPGPRASAAAQKISSAK